IFYVWLWLPAPISVRRISDSILSSSCSAAARFCVLPSGCGLLHLWWISDSDLLFSEFQYLRCRARIPLPHQACSVSVFPSSSAAWRLWFLLHFAAAVTPPAGGTVPGP